MRVINKRFNEFPTPIRKAIKSLSLRKEGHSSLVFQSEPDIDTFIALNEDGILIGWAICSRKWLEHPVVVNRVGVNIEMKRPVIMLYVRKSMRRKGVGSILMSAVIAKHSKVAVCPWNSESRGFFNKLKKNYAGLPNAPGYW